MRVRPATLLAAIGFVFAGGDVGHAAGIFLPADAPAATYAAPVLAEGRAPERYVRMDYDELHRVRAEVENSGQGRLLLDMSEHVALDVAVGRTVRTLDGYTLSGQIDGGRGGFVTLAVRPGAVAGSIWTWEANHEVVPVGGDVHALRQVAHDAWECDSIPQSRYDQSSAPLPMASASNEDAVIDILVFWTPERERLSRDEQALRAHIDLSIAYVNDALERSGALVSLDLVGAERLDAPDPERLETDTSYQYAVLEGAHATQRAEALGADFIHLIVVSTGGSVSGPLSIAGPYHTVFAHEIGHSLGVGHDRFSPSSLKSYFNAYTFADDDGVTSRCYFTLVAYANNCGRLRLLTTAIPYYSTPNRYHPLTGTPLGVSRMTYARGLDGPADAVLAINRNRHRNSNIRSRQVVP